MLRQHGQQQPLCDAAFRFRGMCSLPMTFYSPQLQISSARRQLGRMLAPMSGPAASACRGGLGVAGRSPRAVRAIAAAGDAQAPLQPDTGGGGGTDGSGSGGPGPAAEGAEIVYRGRKLQVSPHEAQAALHPVREGACPCATLPPTAAMRCHALPCAGGAGGYAAHGDAAGGRHAAQRPRHPHQLPRPGNLRHLRSRDQG